MKKTVCLILTAVQVLLCLAGCTGSWPWETPTEPVDTIVYAYPSEMPTYEDNKEMPMIAFWSPPNTEEWYQSMVDCGFTAVIIDAKYNVTPGSEKMMETLAICDEVGIDAYIAINRGLSFTALEEYAEYESFKGINTDEPLSKSDMDTILANMALLHEKYPDKDVEYLTTLISGDPTYYSKDWTGYKDYIDYYLKNEANSEDAFMYDLYPLQGTRLKGQIQKEWLASLETLAAAAKENNKDLYSYLATMSIRGISRRPAEDDLRYTAYVHLAYGVKGLSYFCYMTPGLPPYTDFAMQDWALVNYEDVDDWSTYYKTETWGYVQSLNNELKRFDNVLLSFDWQGVMKSVGKEATTTAGKNCFPNAKNWLKSHDGIKSFTSTEDAILGVFKDENGYDGFMLVNFSDPLDNKENTVTLELRGATRAVVYIQGESQIVDLADGTYTATLQPGEGQFIIPLG